MRLTISSLLVSASGDTSPRHCAANPKRCLNTSSPYEFPFVASRSANLRISSSGCLSRPAASRTTSSHIGCHAFLSSLSPADTFFLVPGRVIGASQPSLSICLARYRAIRYSWNVRCRNVKSPLPPTGASTPSVSVNSSSKGPLFLSWKKERNLSSVSIASGKNSYATSSRARTFRQIKCRSDFLPSRSARHLPNSPSRTRSYTSARRTGNSSGSISGLGENAMQSSVARSGFCDIPITAGFR